MAPPHLRHLRHHSIHGDNDLFGHDDDLVGLVALGVVFSRDDGEGVSRGRVSGDRGGGGGGR